MSEANKMSLKHCPWFRQSSKGRNDVLAPEDADNNPPPYSEPKHTQTVHLGTRILISPSDRARKPLIVAAASACLISSIAITARALAENPDAATAMASVLEKLQKTTATILSARGIEPNSPTAGSIWAGVVDCSAKEARKIASRPDEPGFASDEAAWYERLMANGAADELAIEACKASGREVPH